MSEKRNLVCIVAHPDDVAHSMGGTMLLLKEKYQIHVVCLTKGERGIKDLSMEESAAIREKEEIAAAKLLGSEVTFPGLIDGDVFAGEDICIQVCGILTELKPKAIFTLWPINVPDHFMACAIAVKALHMAGVFYETEVYMSENSIGGQSNQFDPDLYVNIDGVIDKKRELVRCHRSQNPTEEKVEAVIERNRLRGLMARCDFAEPFKTVMPLVGKRWGRKAGSMLLELQ